VLIIYHYTKPPAELPLRYHEVIAARLVRDGAWLAAQPFDMVLDQELPVKLGQEHYGLPKRYDPTLRVRDHDRDSFCRGQSCSVSWQQRGALLQLLTLPLRFSFATGVWLFTHLVDVLGTGPLAKRARIALRPHALGDLVQVREAEVGPAQFHAVWAGYFTGMTTRLGRPRELG
jgi:hypothetical protein